MVLPLVERPDVADFEEDLGRDRCLDLPYEVNNRKFGCFGTINALNTIKIRESQISESEQNMD